MLHYRDSMSVGQAQTGYFYSFNVRVHRRASTQLAKRDENDAVRRVLCNAVLGVTLSLWDHLSEATRPSFQGRATKDSRIPCDELV